MSEDISTPIPDQPGQDPDAVEPGEHTDGYGFSGTLDSGYELGPDGDGEPPAAGAEEPGLPS